MDFNELVTPRGSASATSRSGSSPLRIAAGFRRRPPRGALSSFCDGGLERYDVGGAVESTRNPMQGLHANAEMMEPEFGFNRAMEPEKYDAYKMLAALKRSRGREPEMRDRIMESGFGIPKMPPSMEMDPTDLDWLRYKSGIKPLLSQVNPLSSGLMALLYSGEAGAPESKKGWDWSRRRANWNSEKPDMSQLQFAP